MDSDSINLLVAFQYFQKKETRYSNPHRKQVEVLSGKILTSKKAKMTIIPENAELQIGSIMPCYNKIELFCEDQVNHLSTWSYDHGIDSDYYPNNFLRKMDAVMDLSESTTETRLLRHFKQKIILLTVNRILKMERNSLIQPRSSVRSKLLALVTATINPLVKKSVVRYITDNIKTRLDLGLEWLNKEYSIFRGLQGEQLDNENNISYQTLFCMLSMAIYETNEEDRKVLMTKLYLETPLVPDEAVECWKNIIPDERGLAVIELLRNILMERPGKLRKLLNVLLHYSKHEAFMIRKGSVDMCLDFYGNPIFTKIIEDFALLHIEYLRLVEPPPELFTKDQGRETRESQWTDSSIRACLNLYVGLVERRPHFIQNLERLFTSMHPAVQKIVLKHIRIPMRAFNIVTSLLDMSFVDKCSNFY